MRRAKNICIILALLLAVFAQALRPEEAAFFRLNRLSPGVLILTEISPMENMIVVLASQKGLVVVDTTRSPKLAEAFMRNGDREQATKDYRRSLELDPNNQNAKDMLQRLQDETASK